MRKLPSRGVIQTAPRACALAALFLASALAAFPQSAAVPAPQQAQPAHALVSQTNLVLVRVIVRDAKGNPVTGLSQKDFKLFDNKKQQTISYFRAELPAVSTPAAAKAPWAAVAQQAAPVSSPQRFAALFFDDYHIAFGDLVPVREAARRYLEKNLDAGARVAIFTASGKPQLAFTADRAKLEQALSQLRINNRFESMGCPKLPMYFAQQVADDIPRSGSSALPTAAAGRGGARGGPSMGQVSGPDIAQALDQNDPLKIAEVIAEAQNCPAVGTDPDQDMRNRARDIVLQNNLSIQETLFGLGAVVQRMAETPGDQRTIALAGC